MQRNFLKNLGTPLTKEMQKKIIGGVNSCMAECSNSCAVVFCQGSCIATDGDGARCTSSPLYGTGSSMCPKK
jgi:hypothetical protein